MYQLDRKNRNAVRRATVVGRTDRVTSTAGNSPPEGLFSRGGCVTLAEFSPNQRWWERHAEAEGYLATFLRSVSRWDLLSGSANNGVVEGRLTASEIVRRPRRRRVYIRSFPFVPFLSISRRLSLRDAAAATAAADVLLLLRCPYRVS